MIDDDKLARDAEPEAVSNGQSDAPDAEGMAEPDAAAEPEAVEPKPDGGECSSEGEAAAAGEETAREDPANPELRWYVLRVQVGRENGVKESVERRIKIEGMDWYFGRVLVPTETVTEIREGQKRVVNRRTYAGYIFIEMEMTDESQNLVSETPGIAGFVGVDRRTRTRPAPMTQGEVDKLLKQGETPADEPKVDIKFRPGETVKIKEGPFENFDGVVEEINPAKGLVKVLVTIFGRPTSVELEYWQVEST